MSTEESEMPTSENESKAGAEESTEDFEVSSSGLEGLASPVPSVGSFGKIIVG